MKQFNLQQLENVQLNRNDVDDFDLITAIIEFVPPEFQISPKSLDTFAIFGLSPKNLTRHIVNANQKLANVTIIEGSIELSIEITESQTQAIITLQPINFDFIFRTFQGKASYVSEVGDVTFQDINIRTINLRGIPVPLYILAILGVLATILIFVFRRRITVPTKRAFRR